MLQDGSRSTVIKGIAKAIFSNIEGLVASCALIDAFQDAIEAISINFAEIPFQTGVIMYHARPHVALSKEFRRTGRIETDNITRIIVHSMVIARPGCMRDRRQGHIQGKCKAARLSGLQGGPIEEGVLY